MTSSFVNWKYITKFGFDVGVSKYSMRMKCLWNSLAKNATDYQHETYMDDEWPKAEQIADPCKRKEHARRTRRMECGEMNQFGPWVNGTIGQKLRPHVWYFVLSECTQALFAAPSRTATFVIEFQAMQESGSHFSVEQKWMPLANLLVLLGCTVFLVIFWRKAKVFEQSIGQMHPVIWILGSAALVLYGAQLLHTGHLALFRLNGSGSKAMEILSEILFMLSQVVQSTLLILIALGYTLLQSKLGSLEFVIPILVIVATIHILLVIFAKAQEESANQFTQHEGLKGWLVFAVHVGLYVWFQVAARATAREAGGKVEHFMARFKLAASLYFMAYPIFFFVVRVVAPYWQKPVMEAGLMAAQVGSNIWLATIFLSKGEYFEASSLSSSPLPGSSSPPRFYKDD